jgi:hypothetical protein
VACVYQLRLVGNRIANLAALASAGQWKPHGVRLLARPSLLLGDETPVTGFVRDGPTEIDFGLDDLTVPNRENLSVSESLAGITPALVRDENALAIEHRMNEVEALYHLAVRPAAFKICGAVEAVVERTGEVEIVRDQRLDSRAILADGCFASRFTPL